MSLGLVPKILDSVDVILLVGKQLGMVDAAVMEIRNIQSIVGIECISVNNTVWLYFFLNDRQQRRPRNFSSVNYPFSAEGNRIIFSFFLI